VRRPFRTCAEIVVETGNVHASAEVGHRGVDDSHFNRLQPSVGAREPENDRGAVRLTARC